MFSISFPQNEILYCSIDSSFFENFFDLVLNFFFISLRHSKDNPICFHRVYIRLILLYKYHLISDELFST